VFTWHIFIVTSVSCTVTYFTVMWQLQVCQAAFFLLHPILLYKDPYSSQTSKQNHLMIQAILNWAVAVESWITTPAVRATNMWLQNLSSLVSQLSHRRASEILIC
jgi:hypothetical protein